MPKSNEIEKNILWLQELLQCNKVEAAKIYFRELSLLNEGNLTSIERNMETLKQNSISMQTVTSNPFLITIPNGKNVEMFNCLIFLLFFNAAFSSCFLLVEIQPKLDILSEMMPKQLSDFIPLAALTLDQLQQIKIQWKKDQPSFSESHRVYFFSNQLNIEPQSASKYFAKYPKVFFMHAGELKKKLTLLLSLNIPSENILCSMNHFLLTAETMQHKLNYLKENGVVDIKPWMICRPDHQLEK